METSGLALLEAMAAGIPAVATRVGGIEETAPPGAATLVAPGDPAALATAILALLADPAEQIARGPRRRGRAHRAGAPPSGCCEVYETASERRRGCRAGALDAQAAWRSAIVAIDALGGRGQADRDACGRRGR